MNTQDSYEDRHAGARARVMRAEPDASRLRLAMVELCAKVATQRARAPRGSFRRSMCDDQLDRTLELLARAVRLDEARFEGR